MKKNGFTLIELMVVIAIIAILAGVAIPGVVRWLPDYRLKSAARDVYSNMQLAKMGAVKANADWAIYFDPGVTPGRYFICSDDNGDGWDGPPAVGGNDVVKKTVDLSTYESGIGYGHGNATTNATVGGGAFPADEISYNPNVAIFTPKGTVNTLGYVYLSNNKGSSYAVATPTIAGVIILRKWMVTAWE